MSCSRHRWCRRASRRRRDDLSRRRVCVCRGAARGLPVHVAAPAARVRTRAVVVGAGPAGDAVAAGLRDAGWDGEITLIGAEPELPYERPHLSKGYLAGTVAREKLPLRPAQQYRDLRVELVLGEQVVDLGLERRAAVLANDSEVPWDLICVATGSDARRLTGHDDALYLRELPQADRLRAHIERRESLTIAGAGFIGCEVAAVAVEKGCQVHLYEALEQPMLRVLGPERGAYVAQVHRAHGVELHLRAEPPPNTQLVAVGSTPRTRDGITVDEMGRTSVDGIY